MRGAANRHSTEVLAAPANAHVDIQSRGGG
jgi:hypothetical protein